MTAPNPAGPGLRLDAPSNSCKPARGERALRPHWAVTLELAQAYKTGKSRCPPHFAEQLAGPAELKHPALMHGRLPARAIGAKMRCQQRGGARGLGRHSGITQAGSIASAKPGGAVRQAAAGARTRRSVRPTGLSAGASGACCGAAAERSQPAPRPLVLGPSSVEPLPCFRNTAGSREPSQGAGP